MNDVIFRHNNFNLNEEGILSSSSVPISFKVNKGPTGYSFMYKNQYLNTTTRDDIENVISLSRTPEYFNVSSNGAIYNDKGNIFFQDENGDLIDELKVILTPKINVVRNNINNVLVVRKNETVSWLIFLIMLIIVIVLLLVLIFVMFMSNRKTNTMYQQS